VQSEVVAQHAHPAIDEVHAFGTVALEADALRLPNGDRRERFEGIGPRRDLAAQPEATDELLGFARLQLYRLMRSRHTQRPGATEARP